MHHFRYTTVAVLSLTFLGGCTADKPLPPVFNAVFGLSSAQSNPYSVGRIDEKSAGPRDTVVGAPANSPGNCIWEDDGARRFRDTCPEGYTTSR